MDNIDDYDNDGIDFAAPLHIPSVIIGLIMMISGFFLPVFLENQGLKILCLVMFCLSFFVMTRTQNNDSDLS